MKNSLQKKLGVIVGVNGSISQVGMYSMSNDSNFLWHGEVLTGPKIGAFLTINQNDIKIIASVSTEKIIDQQNTVKSVEFDNRFNKNALNRLITLKTKGVIENGEFQVTSQYVPMVGNEVTLTSREELNLIYGVEKNEHVIYLGKSLLENQVINLSINNFFASHIGISGNTGSGKSNTMHKLYLELFRKSFLPKIEEHSQFFIIDFNGEYTNQNSFGLDQSHKKVFDISTRFSDGTKLPIKQEYLFDPDILSILFDATTATQVPFLRNAMKIWDESQFDGTKFSKFVIGTLKRILTTGNDASSEAKNMWADLASNFVKDTELFKILKSIDYNTQYQSYIVEPKLWINNKSGLSAEAYTKLQLDGIQVAIANQYDISDIISKLKIHLEFQKIHQVAWRGTNIEFINPLFKRIDSSINSLIKVIEIVDETNGHFKMLNVVSLVNCNQEIKRVVPMLLSKMIYDEQKMNVTGKNVNNTKHLIIDEAHNILKASYVNNNDGWQDYRIAVFEEIIKEGRKFGFYLTLSSQRPADISPTILSQVHNYFIHRLVNEKDLRMLENTMPTLDNSSYEMIPSLGKGEAIVTGNAMQVPIFVKVEKEKNIRPNSDDIKLSDVWEI